MPRVAAVVLALVLAVMPAFAQTPQSDPLEFYKGYLAVLAKATSLGELLPFYTKELSTGLAKMPKEMQGNYLKMRARSLTDLKVLKKDVKGDKATYELEATAADGQPAKGTATLVKEGGAWKVDDDAWAVNLPRTPAR